MERDEYDDVYKIIVVGDASVGKTNIIHCYSKGKIANNTMPTVGVEYASKIIPLRTNNGQQKRAKVQIWDTAGQEQYRSITMTYHMHYLSHYKKAFGAIIMFDLTNPHSFSSIEYWVNIVKDRADSRVQIGIVGNKADLTSKRAISRQDAQSLARKLGAFYDETSIKDFTQIQLTFEKLVQSKFLNMQDVFEVQRNKDEFANGTGQKLRAINNEADSGCKC